MAEGMAGTEKTFASLMNAEARKLGLTNSHFTNATGLPDPDEYVTALDLARLARHIIYDYPEFYPIFSETEFTWNKIRQHNRNPLLEMNIGADGLKTGFTEDSGYGLVASAVRDGQRLIMVINGTKSEKERAEEARKLMDWGLRGFEKVELFRPGEEIARATVFGGAEGSVGVVGKGGVTALLAARLARSHQGPRRLSGPGAGAGRDRPGDRQAADHARHRRAARGAGLCQPGRRPRHAAPAGGGCAQGIADRLDIGGGTLLLYQPTMAGKFITFEGGEGAGKSTQIRLLAERLQAAGVTCVLTREPGGTEKAEAIRRLLLSGLAEQLGVDGEAVLFAAARADHVETVIRPALEAGRWVLCDRFYDSTHVYQADADPAFLDALDRVAVGGTRPDLTIVLDIPAELGLARAADRMAATGTTPDRFERDDDRPPRAPPPGLPEDRGGRPRSAAS